MFYELPGEENSEDDEDFALASEGDNSEGNSGSGSVYLFLWILSKIISFPGRGF